MRLCIVCYCFAVASIIVTTFLLMKDLRCSVDLVFKYIEMINALENSVK